MTSILKDKDSASCVNPWLWVAETYKKEFSKLPRKVDKAEFLVKTCKEFIKIGNDNLNHYIVNTIGLVFENAPVIFYETTVMSMKETFKMVEQKFYKSHDEAEEGHKEILKKYSADKS